MKSILLLLSCLALCLSSVVVAPTIHAQVPDSCLKLIQKHDPGDGYINRDSITVDSCIGSPTYGKWYGRKFVVVFNQTIIFLPWAKLDTVIEFSWQTIDTTFPAIRSAFQQLENHFGTFWLWKPNPQDTTLNNPGNTIYFLRFADRVPVDSIVNLLLSIPSSRKAYFNSYYDKTSGIPNDRGMKLGTSLSEIYAPDGNSSSHYDLNWHRLGWLWNLYRIQAPMAWEITQGKNSVKLCANDEFDPPTPDIHPDLNIARTENSGNGTLITVPFGDTFHNLQTNTDDLNHGVTVIGMAVAKGNNDGTLTDRKGMVGTCPNCIGLLLQGSAPEFAEYDIDNSESNKTWQHFDVTNTSYGLAVYDRTQYDSYKIARFRAGIDSGIVMIVGGGNDRKKFGRTDVVNIGTSSVPIYASARLPAKNYPGAISWTDVDINPSNAPQKDVKIICVGATEDEGSLRFAPSYSNPSLRCTERPLDDGSGPVYIDGKKECFIADWTFSPGTDKFNNDNNRDIRQSAKDDAYIDIVAPGGAVLVAANRPDLFNVNYNGTSQAAPTVMGIVGLMYSVYPKIGVNIRVVVTK